VNKFWNPPGSGSIKINVDGAYRAITGEAAVGLIAHDSVGQPHIMAWRLLFHCADAEATTILEGLHFADRWPNSVKVIIETDCSNLITKVMADGKDRSTTSA
jgi:ribonuclease HI